ncbi:MAG: M24 family metallopeptidase [bacterium]
MSGRIDRSVFTARIQRLQAGLKAEALDGLVATKPQTFFYLSDFNPILFSHPTIVVLPANGSPTLLVWAIRLDHAKAEAMIDDVRLFGRWGDKPFLALDPYDALVKVLTERGLMRATLGIEEDHLSAKLLTKIRSMLPETTLKDVSSLIEHARLVKDVEEVARLRSAAKLADAGMLAAVEAIRERRTEAEIGMRAEIAMRELWAREYPDHETAGFAGSEGAIWSALWCWVVSGPRLMINADTPKARKVQDGEFALPQVWAVFDGYTAENERTVAVGAMSAEMRRGFDAVIAARAATFGAVRPGATCEQVYEAAAAVFRQQGFERYLPGRIGHSIGLGPHEHLSLGPGEKTVLVPGMALTIEPGLFYPGGNVRHSDTIVVTAGGHEVLTRTPAGILQV